MPAGYNPGVKQALLSVIAAFLMAPLAWAQPSSDPAKWDKRKVRPPYLQVYVIDPPHPINWKSPKTLLQSTLRNGLEMDYAPNGHLAVYIKSRKPNAYGVTSILTGMGRTNKFKTLWDTLYKQYGLTAMVHEFGGDLESAEATQHEIDRARKTRRLSKITVQLNDESADRLMGFMENWIRFGSFRHYGGNKSVPKGEGSGCADFAVHFIQLALDGQLPSQDWSSSVFMPYELLQEAPGRAPKKVSALEIIRKDVPWAKSEKDGLKFSIPDPEKMTKWIKARSPFTKNVQIFPEDYFMTEKAYIPMDRFQSPYPRESEQTVQEKWKSIRSAY